MLTAGGIFIFCIEKLSNEVYGEHKSTHYHIDHSMGERHTVMRYSEKDDSL